MTKTHEKIQYIHYGYGLDYFDKNKIEEVKNSKLSSRPDGGFWASRTTATYGWKEWCIEDGYTFCNLDESFKFTLKDGANVVYLFNKDDIEEQLPLLGYNRERYIIDFEKAAEIGIDAVEILCIDNLRYAMYGWESNSIFIINPDIIEVVE